MEGARGALENVKDQRRLRIFERWFRCGSSMASVRSRVHRQEAMRRNLDGAVREIELKLDDGPKEKFSGRQALIIDGNTCLQRMEGSCWQQG